MDYKQEAERLIELFWPFVEHTTGDKHDKDLERENCKACAAIHCKVIIDVLIKINDDYDDNFLDNRIEDWNKVLEHIKQL